MAKDIDETREATIEELAWGGPGIEIWPDDHAAWVASHRRQRRALECAIPYVQASPFCGLGFQSS